MLITQIQRETKCPQLAGQTTLRVVFANFVLGWSCREVPVIGGSGHGEIPLPRSTSRGSTS